MSIENWLEDLLPTKWARRAAYATVVISVSAYNSPSLLPASFLPASPEQVFLIRLVLFFVVATVGSLLVLVLLVRAYHAQAAAYRRQIDSAQLAHSQELESRANAEFHKPLNYPSLGIS